MTADKTLFPYYSLVPKSYDQNLAFRREMIKLGSSDKKHARDIWRMCARDLLFYCNCMAYVFEPRTARIHPFITYEFQDEAFTEIITAMGDHDLVISKSRDMGATWMCCTAVEWKWHFHDMNTFLLVSRKEALIDATNDPKSMFYKIDFIHKYLPGWLLPPMERMKMHLKNNDNGSVIDGESTTAEAGTGDRRYCIIFDEFSKMPDSHKIAASSRDVSKCRIFNFSAYGTGNAAYDLTCNPKFKQLRLHWTRHPEKIEGLYADAVTGKPRSKWYDKECERAVNQQEIGQELDIDFLGSSYQFFDAIKIGQIERTFCRAATHQGEVMFDKVKLKFEKFVESSTGCLRLWRSLIGGEVGKTLMARDKYAFGVDVSFGTGASNSSVSIGSISLGEKIGEYTNPKLPPHEFANMVFVLSQFFLDDKGEPPEIAWEDNGPGAVFARRLMELGYRNFYYRRNEKSLTRKITDKPGWHSSDETKLLLLSNYRQALCDDAFVNHSIEAVQECHQYIRGTANEIYHAKSRSTIDPSGARENHGDRVIADALCWMVMSERPIEAEVVEAEIPVNSLMWRRERSRKELAKSKDGW